MPEQQLAYPRYTDNDVRKTRISRRGCASAACGDSNRLGRHSVFSKYTTSSLHTSDQSDISSPLLSIERNENNDSRFGAKSPQRKLYQEQDYTPNSTQSTPSQACTASSAPQFDNAFRTVIEVTALAMSDARQNHFLRRSITAQLVRDDTRLPLGGA
jgi:hypothetical protein